ncbi:hypothetical protein SGLAM104S_10445 [Streptomyces glaucescens]
MAAQQRHHAHPEPGGDQPQLGVGLGGPVAEVRLDALGSQGEHQPLVAELPLGPGDPLVLGELREVHLVPPGQGMAGRQGDVGRVVEDRRLHQAVGQRHRLVVPVEDHGEVEVAAHHAPDPVSGSSSQERSRSPGCSARSAASAVGNRPRAAVGNADSAPMSASRRRPYAAATARASTAPSVQSRTTARWTIRLTQPGPSCPGRAPGPR